MSFSHWAWWLVQLLWQLYDDGQLWFFTSARKVRAPIKQEYHTKCYSQNHCTGDMRGCDYETDFPDDDDVSSYTVAGLVTSVRFKMPRQNKQHSCRRLYVNDMNGGCFFVYPPQQIVPSRVAWRDSHYVSNYFPVEESTTKCPGFIALLSNLNINAKPFGQNAQMCATASIQPGLPLYSKMSYLSYNNQTCGLLHYHCSSSNTLSSSIPILFSEPIKTDEYIINLIL